MSTTSSARATALQWRGLLLVSLAGVVWGTIGPAVQLVHEGSGLSPLTISAYRAIAAVAVLLVLAAVTGRLGLSWSLARHQWRRVTVVGVLIAASQLLFFVAVVATGVSVATVVCLGVAPVLLLIVSKHPATATFVHRSRRYGHDRRGGAAARQPGRRCR